MQFIDKEKIMPEYVSRTLINLDIVKKAGSRGYEVTQLVNSLVGLLILPKEKVFSDVCDESVSKEILTQISDKVSICKDRNEKDEEKNLKNIIRHMRNGVCHFHLDFLGNNGKIEEIKIEDYYEDKKTNRKLKTFAVELSIELLEKFILQFDSSMIKTQLNQKQDTNER